jgi:hypothetical protein
MKVSVRQDRFIIDTPSIGLVIAALDSASDAWLESASTSEPNTSVRKQMLKMAGEAKALSILIQMKVESPDEPVPLEPAKVPA